MASLTLPCNVSRADPEIPIMIGILLGVSAIVVCLRVWGRAIVKKNAGWDDTLIVLALIFAVLHSACHLMQIYKGDYGHHRACIQPDRRKYVSIYNIPVSMFGPISVAFSRASIVIALLRIISHIKRWAYLLYIAMFINLGVCIGTIIIYPVRRIPLSLAWNPKQPGFQMNSGQFDEIVKAFSGFNCVVDFMCALIPFAAFREVQLSPRTKLGLSVILGCGIITAACSIGRITTLDFSSNDTEWDNVTLAFWTESEIYGAIIFATLPALRQLIVHVRHTGSLLPSKGGSDAYSRKNSRKTSGSARHVVTIGSVDDRHSKHVGSRGIGRTTDVYVELSDIERGESGERIASEGKPMALNGLDTPQSRHDATAEGLDAKGQYRRPDTAV